jgi:hypothetical protein
MTCQDCELLLAMEESSAELDRHLGECAECRTLAAELAANSDALREMATEAMPSVRGAVLAEVRAQNARRNVVRWGWALAAAAALVIAIGVSRMRTPVATLPTVAKMQPTVEAPVVRQPVHVAASRLRVERRLERRRQPERLAPQQPERLEALKVKMLTSDPDVVIYWLVEPKEGSE